MPSQETSQNKLNPRIGYVVEVDESGTDPVTTAVGIVEDGSVEYSLNEENDDFNPFGDTRLLNSPTTEDPKVNFTGAREIPGTDEESAFDKLGIRDDSNDGEYIRDEDRVWSGEISLEIWYYQNKPADGDPALADAFEDVRWDVESPSQDGNAQTFDILGHVEGDIYFDTTPTTAP